MGKITGEDGKAVIVAMDHGGFMGPMEGIEKPCEMIEKLKKGGADALLVTPGIIKRCVDELSKGNLGVIMRIDGAGTVHSDEDADPYLLLDLDVAATLGVDGVVAMGYLGSPTEGMSLELLSKIANDCEKEGLPLLAEMYPTTDDPTDPEIVGLGARVGSEIGADFIKTQYTGNPESFEEIVESTPVPIVILGGPKQDSTMDVLKNVEGAMEAGTIGIAFGRNIWQSDDPAGMVEAVVKIVHEGEAAEEAIRELE